MIFGSTGCHQWSLQAGPASSRWEEEQEAVGRNGESGVSGGRDQKKREMSNLKCEGNKEVNTVIDESPQMLVCSTGVYHTNTSELTAILRDKRRASFK